MTRQLIAESLGTALLLISVVGSGIMAQTLYGDDIGSALLANAIATGCMLFVIITIFGPVSGAHFNPIVSFVFVIRGEMKLPQALGFCTAQILGGLCGVWLTHIMFDTSVFQMSTTSRATLGLYVSEIVASVGLLLVIFGTIYARPQVVAGAVGLYITGAYWFTSSTSFANPAVTIARAFSDTFAGIQPAHVPMFIAMQCIGLVVSIFVIRILWPPE